MTELNELIYAGAKLVCEKIGIPQKARKKIKTWMENLTGKADKNLQKHDKLIKQRKDAEYGDKKERQHKKNNNTIWEINQKVKKEH